jgi:hypothetical protein
MRKEIDCSYTDEIVCPYCGTMFSDSWEYKEGIIDCVDCDKKFSLSVNYSVDYSTSKVPCANDEGEHRWSEWLSYIPTRDDRYCKCCDKREYRTRESAE